MKEWSIRLVNGWRKNYPVRKSRDNSLSAKVNKLKHSVSNPGLVQNTGFEKRKSRGDELVFPDLPVYPVKTTSEVYNHRKG